MKLVGDEEAEKIHEILENVATRFDSLKNDVRERTNTLDDALLQTSQVQGSFCEGRCPTGKGTSLNLFRKGYCVGTMSKYFMYNNAISL